MFDVTGQLPYSLPAWGKYYELTIEHITRGCSESAAINYCGDDLEATKADWPDALQTPIYVERCTCGSYLCNEKPHETIDIGKYVHMVTFCVMYMLLYSV